MTPSVRWIDPHALLLLHDESLAMFGGAAGLRDPGLFESALARPVNLKSYHPESTITELAASYAFGLARNHPFVDGNKRCAFLALGLFLAINGWVLKATQIAAIDAMLALARGDLDEPSLAAWIKANAAPTQTAR